MHQREKTSIMGWQRPSCQNPRSTPSNITRTIHQQGTDNSSMVAGAPQFREPLSIICTPVWGTACRFPYSLYRVWATTVELVASTVVGSMGTPLHGPNTINSGHLCLLKQFQVMAATHLTNNTQHINNGSRIWCRPTNSWWPTIIQVARVCQISNITKKINHLQTLW